MRRVLIAMEGASSSDDAIQQFASWFQPDGLTVFIVSVIPPVSYPVAPEPGSPVYLWQSEEALIALDRASALLARAGFTAFSMIRIGETVETILDVAQELDADLIVLGTQGRKGIKRLIRDSVAESVALQASCDVMIYPFDGFQAHASPQHPAA